MSSAPWSGSTPVDCVERLVRHLSMAMERQGLDHVEQSWCLQLLHEAMAVLGHDPLRWTRADLERLVDVRANAPLPAQRGRHAQRQALSVAVDLIDALCFVPGSAALLWSRSTPLDAANDDHEPPGAAVLRRGPRHPT